MHSYSKFIFFKSNSLSQQNECIRDYIRKQVVLNLILIKRILCLSNVYYTIRKISINKYKLKLYTF